MTISVITVLVLSLSLVQIYVLILLVLTERAGISRMTETAVGGVLQVVPTLAVMTGRRMTETELTQRTYRVITVSQTVSEMLIELTMVARVADTVSLTSVSSLTDCIVLTGTGENRELQHKCLPGSTL